MFSLFTREHLFSCLSLGVLCFATGALASHFSKNITTPDTSGVMREGKGNYEYIDPLLLCQNYESDEAAEFSPLKKEFQQITTTAISNQSIISGSVYFRTLTTGKWTGLSENEPYTPASLLKVPILIAYLKMAEKNPELLKEKINYVQEKGQMPPLIDIPVLSSGNNYSIEELLRGMIIDSDNSATNLLESRMDKNFLDDVYSELGIPSPYYGANTTRDQYKISTKLYALFFRILYNATFLTRDMSERAFEILSQVKFNKGLRAGTPRDIPVANKYGFAILKPTEPRIIELSDCGILYVPNNPLLLCVMAHGNNPDVASSYIKNITLATNHFFGTK